MNPALAYAENQLGVHQVLSDAEVLLTRLDEYTERLDIAIDSRKHTDDAIDSRQMDLLIEERGKHSELSQAAMDRRLKERYHTDETLRQLRIERNKLVSEVSGFELEIENIKYQLKVKVARMNELGGYFQYLASVKNAAVSEASTSRVETQATGGEANSTQQQET